MATRLRDCVYDDQQPRREESNSFSTGAQIGEKDCIAISAYCKAVAGEPIAESEREVEPFGSINTAVMAGLLEEWQLQWKTRRTFTQASEEEVFNVQMRECIMRRTLTAKLFKYFLFVIFFLLTLY